MEFLFGSQFVPFHCSLIILRDAKSFSMQQAQHELSPSKFLFGSPSIPLQRNLVILGNTVSCHV